MSESRLELNPGNAYWIGVSALAEMYGRGKWWARQRLREWEAEQNRGGPVRVFRRGSDGAVFTTLAVVNQWMPPSRDIVLYNRVAAVESELVSTCTRLDREVLARQRGDADLHAKLKSVGQRR